MGTTIGGFQVLKTVGEAGSKDYEEIIQDVQTENTTKIEFCNGNGSTPTEVSFNNQGNPIFSGSNHSADMTFLNTKLYDAFTKLVGKDGILDESDINIAKQMFGNKLDDSKLKSDGIIKLDLNEGSYFTVDIYTKAEKDFDKKLKEETTSDFEKAGNTVLKWIWKGFANWMDKNTKQWERSTGG